MSKAIQGAAMLGGALALGTAALLDPALVLSPLFDKALAGLALGGISMEAGAIAGALTSNRGMAITTRQTAAARQVIYGQQRIGGVFIYKSTTGSHHDQFNYVIVLAGHECDSIVNLYLDGRQVHWKGSGPGWTVRNGIGFGGDADDNEYVGPNGVHYNFGGKVYCEPRFGDQLDGDVISGLTANDPIWAADGSGNSPWVAGCTYVYLKIENSPGTFPGEPEVRFTVNGKNNIWDPRTGTRGFTNNWALICADVITDDVFGLADDSVNQAQLIAAANVCDEMVALGVSPGTLTERRYTTNYHTDTATAPGDMLAAMLPGAAGRISRIGGEWFLWPAYWQGPSFSFDEGDLTDTLQWKPYRSVRDLINRVNGTYTAPTYPYNIAGNLYDQNGFYNGSLQNNFSFAFQPTNFPQYAADTLHGYASDQWLTEDGGFQHPKELALTTVLSVGQAQRVAKITLLRNRQQGSGHLEMFPKAFQMQECDVMNFTFAANGWTNKTLEVNGISFRLEEGEDGVPVIRIGVDVIETDPSVYEWSTSEELTVYDIPATPAQTPQIPAAPTGLTLLSNAGTAVVGADGVTVPRIGLSWTSPMDVLTTQIVIQYQLAGAGSWTDGGTVSVVNTASFISGVVAGATYNVRIAGMRPRGTMSAWEEVDGLVVAAPGSSLLPSALPAATPSAHGVVLLAAGASGSTLAAVATSGTYASLTGTPTNSDGQIVQAVTSGAPSNTPAAGAMAFDPAANKLWIYGSAGWKSVTLA